MRDRLPETPRGRLLSNPNPNPNRGIRAGRRRVRKSLAYVRQFHRSTAQGETGRSDRRDHGELCTRSDEFRTRWGAHNMRHHGIGTKRFHHRVVGDLALAIEDLEMAAEPGLALTTYTAEPGSPSAEALALLASWAATHEAGPSPDTLSTP